MGFDEESINVVEIAKIAEKAGVAAIAIRAYAITNKSLLVSMLRSYQRNGTRGWYFGGQWRYRWSATVNCRLGKE